MLDKKQTTQIIGYFEDSEGWQVLLIIIGGLIWWLGESALWGGILIAIGVFLTWASHLSPLTDQEIDEIIDKGLELAKQKALNKSNIDDSEMVGDQVVITGPRLTQTGGSKIYSKKGKDKELRFSPINVTVLSFTQNQLLSYQASYDVTTESFLMENTDEYFYKDVVSVSTKTKSYKTTIKNKEIEVNEAEMFELTTSGGTSIEVLLRDPKLIKEMGGGEIPTTDSEKAIQAVRKMLRERKEA